MINVGRIGENILTVIILIVFFYLIYSSSQGNKLGSVIKGLFKRDKT